MDKPVFSKKFRKLSAFDFDNRNAGKRSLTDEYFICRPKEPVPFNNGIVFYIEGKKKPKEDTLSDVYYTYKRGIYAPANARPSYVDCGDVIAAVAYKKDREAYEYFDHKYFEVCDKDKEKKSLYTVVEELKREYIQSVYMRKFVAKTNKNGWTTYTDSFLNLMRDTVTSTKIENHLLSKLVYSQLGNYKAPEGSIEDVCGDPSDILSYAIKFLQSKFLYDGFNMFYISDIQNSELVYCFYLAAIKTASIASRSYYEQDLFHAYPEEKDVIAIYNKRFNRYRMKKVGANSDIHQASSDEYVVRDKFIIKSRVEFKYSE